MGKETVRPAPEKENDKQEGVLKDDDLKDVVGAGLDSLRPLPSALRVPRPVRVEWRLTTRPIRRRRRRAPARRAGAVTFGGARAANRSRCLDTISDFVTR